MSNLILPMIAAHENQNDRTPVTTELTKIRLNDYKRIGGSIQKRKLKKYFKKLVHGDARKIPIKPNSVDLIVTSPPYWNKRDYGFKSQIGQEKTPREYIENIREAFQEWRRVLRKTGSVFFNIGDSYYNR